MPATRCGETRPFSDAGLQQIFIFERILGSMEQRKFKKHEICLMVNAIIRDESALRNGTVRCKSKWGY